MRSRYWRLLLSGLLVGLAAVLLVPGCGKKKAGVAPGAPEPARVSDPGPGPQAERPENAAATVGEVVVTLDALERETMRQIGHRSFTEEQKKRVRNRALDELIEAELVRQAAAKHGIEVTAGELEQELAAAVKERGGPEKFEVSLGKEGHTREQFMERVKTTLQRKKLRELLVPFEVTDEEVRRYYDTRYVKRTVRPGQKEPDPVKPFEEVKESIRRTIKARKVQEGTRTLIERLQAEFPVKRYQ